jgi:peptidylprolyl isomerase
MIPNLDEKGDAMSDPENTLVLKLEDGDVTIALRPDLAPQHVARIKELAREGFYDGLTFHRVIEGFMAQGGCPEGSGRGGTGAKLRAEFSKELHVRGACSMARAADPNSGDCQFFICFAAAPFLDGKYTVWGAVTEGMEHIDALPRGEPPRQPGRIVSLSVAADA